ncbi:Type VI secretion system (T6SS), amidase effector protein 4 [Pedobacter terrae]|uniref:Type VI secretion system (T6SS), amidase effector protein 4 n=1 Tax=Pedobacter terrae TaxID=405671 RepID=A0A1G8CYL4_9SPHI|nr:T6SS effector amidase Tae4 family protein [Pedobacter terrae]SDH50010.1 Type VI secretion system (T6SS), amidase effector protein 4 [Pedobacter terrae]
MANVQFNTYTPQVSDNDFVPIVSLNHSQEFIGCKLKVPSKVRTTKLSGHIDENKRNQRLDEIIHSESMMIIRVDVKQGSKKANDNKGYVTVKSKGLKFIGSDNKTENAKHEIKLKQAYNSIITLKIAVEKLKDKQEYYIDFFADDDDLFFYTLSNVFCGRISVTYIEPLFFKIYKNYPKPYSNKPCTDGHYNQCAIRMSMALINSGVPLTGVVNYTNPGGYPYCTHKHVLGAYNLKKHIDKLSFWEKRIQINGTKENAYNKLSNKKGILYFENFKEEVNGTMQRRAEFRHIEVWDGVKLISGFDGQMFDATEIVFWEVH